MIVPTPTPQRAHLRTPPLPLTPLPLEHDDSLAIDAEGLSRNGGKDQDFRPTMPHIELGRNLLNGDVVLGMLFGYPALETHVVLERGGDLAVVELDGESGCDPGRERV